MPEPYIDSRMHAVMHGHIPLPAKEENPKVVGLDLPHMTPEKRAFWIDLLDVKIPLMIQLRKLFRPS